MTLEIGLGNGSLTQSRCSLCGRPLDVAFDPLSGDCGGDCWGCIGLIEAELESDAGWKASGEAVSKEIVWGWREADGRPKSQDFFSAPTSCFICVRRHHSLASELVELWIEFNEGRQEVRKIEIWRDGRVGYAFGGVAVGGTRLGEEPVPSVSDLAKDPLSDSETVSRAAFEQCWTLNMRQKS